MTARFILGSASPARLGLLTAAGLTPEVIVSGVDEDGVTADDVASLTAELARLKAVDVAARIEGPAYVLGCDSLLELDGKPCGKPHDAEEATARWRAMRGRSGVLHTGHCLIDTSSGRRLLEVASTAVHFAKISDEEITAYVATGEPLYVAGAFTIDGYASPFVERIEGDHGNVVGVSLPLLRRMFAEFGVSLPSLWAQRPPA
ncbi:Maf family protein [Phytomonospora endophytica]|uniref:Nucleoside triphosphate pyrophosphatase n=1 Tax=Phytomonospora endophytica TaxID=714109 RepID=A0A841FE40_9ACTN|nr:septum formation protein [Phytomonospora endophytica]GIG65509.1 Maf-like protein [Phytomonospora endophytica]